MLNRTQDELLVLDNFIIDKTLPKYSEKKSTSNLNIPQFRDHPATAGSTFMDSEATMSFDDGGVPSSFASSTRRLKNKNRWWKFWLWQCLKKKPKYTVLDFFKNVKGTLTSVEKYTTRVDSYVKLVDRAQKSGQHALVEKLKVGIETVKFESILYSGGFEKCISEELIIKFYKESEKGLSLVWVGNFGRVIPEEVVSKKADADKLMVFDNYLVLHYDPQQKSFIETEKEKEKRKDPILFGVVKGVRKLYYVADWIDEFCDLNLEDFVKKFGSEISDNNIQRIIK